MKKTICAVLALLMLLLLAACGAKSPDSTKGGYTGTWEIDHLIVDDVKYTKSELEALDNFRAQAWIVIKDGGQAYAAEGGTDGVIVDWSETENGILLNGDELLMEDGFLCLEAYSDEFWYFRKVSDSQLITLPPTPTEEKSPAETTEPASTSTENTAAEGLRPEFKAAMDEYEAFFEEYVAFMAAYKEAEDVTSMMGEYSSMMMKYVETMAALQEIDENTLTDEEALYYAEVMLRINQKVLAAA